MAYAAITDMVARYGEAELIRLTTPEGAEMGSVDATRVATLLDDASALVDSYLRRRYLTPVTPTPQELTRAACILARFDLAQGESREPSAQMTAARKDVIAWLVKLGDGTVLLADATPAGEQSFSQVQTRADPGNYADSSVGVPAVQDVVPGPAQFFSGWV